MVIGNAKKAGVKKFIVPGVDYRSSQQAIELAQKHPGVIFASIGIHPYEAQKIQEIDNLYNLYKSYKRYIVAIGECGLDYHQYKGHSADGRKQNQRRLFGAQLKLAIRYDLPMIIHCRDAWEDLFDVIDSLPSLPKGVLHCFSGGLAHLRAAQQRGLYIGIDGNVTYLKYLQTIVTHIPLSLLLLETDTPYLTPTPHRGSRNEPKYIPLVAKKIAELQNIFPQDVAEQTTRNAQSLFGL